jgi:hypothetical protein
MDGLKLLMRPPDFARELELIKGYLQERPDANLTLVVKNRKERR